jgi:hypothetical protein
LMLMLALMKSFDRNPLPTTKVICEWLVFEK